VDQSTIPDDVRAFMEMSQRFIYDLAKSDLAYYYKQSIDDVDEAKAWYDKENGMFHYELTKAVEYGREEEEEQ
jgi:hypothetical protein